MTFSSVPLSRRWASVRPATSRSARVAGVLVAGALVAGACGGGDPPSRPDVTAAIADDVVVPSLERLVAATAALVDSTEALCAAPDAATVATARDRLAAARDAWSRNDALTFGPVEDRHSSAVIDWPVDAADIESLIADTAVELDLERLGRRIGADQRGLGAIDHVLGPPTDTDALLAALDADPRRCDFLVGVAVVAAEEAALLPDDWTVDFEDEGPYRDTFSAVDGGGVDQVVNRAILVLEAMTDRELGAALGAFEDDADPEAIVEGPAGLGVADLDHRLEGVRTVVIGTGDVDGLAPLLGDDLTGRLRRQFDAAALAIDALDPPLRAAVENDATTVAAAREAIKAVQVTVATEVVSMLGVTIGFSDADGDSG